MRESFSEFSADAIRDKLKLILQMAVVLTSAPVQVVKFGGIADSSPKPRSSPTEEIDGQVLESFRGHMVNDDAPEAGARVDPHA